jgi:hypothetical protein
MRCTSNRLTRSQRRGSRYFGFYRTRFRIFDYEHEYRFAEYRLAEWLNRKRPTCPFVSFDQPSPARI